jgi:hypothetical protein
VPSVADSRHLRANPDPEPAFYFHTDPDPALQAGHAFHFHTDPDPALQAGHAFHFHTDPDPALQVSKLTFLFGWKTFI